MISRGWVQDRRGTSTPSVEVLSSISALPSVLWDDLKTHLAIDEPRLLLLAEQKLVAAQQYAEKYTGLAMSRRKLRVTWPDFSGRQVLPWGA